MNLKLNHQKTYAGACFRFCLVSTLLAGGVGAQAEGFRNSTIGASDLGRSGGRIAQVDDATAVQHNPANMLAVTNAQIEFAPTVIYMKVDYTSSSGGQAASTIHPVKILPNFFVTVPVVEDRVVAGLGVTVPYGLASEWDTSDSAFNDPTSLRYTSPYYAELITVNCNPSVAVKLNDQFRVGVGLDVMWSQLEFKQKLPMPMPGFPNAYANAKGTGVGVGGNLGITWLMTEKQTLALTYRSTMTVDYSGDTDFYNTPAGNPSTSFDSQIKFPNIIAAGYGIKLTDTVRLGADFEWLQFSQFKNLPVKIGSNPLGVPSQNIPEKWNNSFTVGLGADWQFSEHWVLRGGYQYFKTPVPDSTFSPTIPDANQNVLTTGLGWAGKHSSFEIAYGLDFYDDRNINNDQQPAFNGKYTFTVHLFSLAYRYSF